MLNEAIKTNILGVQIIPNISEELRVKYRIKKGYQSLGIITTDCDDVSYAALDEATKRADVAVAEAKSMYAGFKNASTALAGEFIGILAARTPEEVRSGLEAAISFMEENSFHSANEDNSIVYYAQCISRSGRYLSRKAGIAEGEALAYLVAPPLEALVGIDAALKVSCVELKVLEKAPTETNFSGALLHGDQAACKAACDAFSQKVCEIAQNPRIL